VDESRLSLVKAGQTVDVALESLDRRFPAHVSESCRLWMLLLVAIS